MNYFLSIIFFCFVCQIRSQVVFDKTTHDFGEINPEDTRFVDFKLTNTSPKNAFLLRIDAPSEVTYIRKGNELEKDSSIYLRFQVNPTKKGKFNYTIPIYLSDRNTPVKLRLTGELLSTPSSTSFNFTQCPSFGSNPAGKNPLDFDLYLTIIDEKTNQPVPNSTVLILQNGQALGKWKTDKNGVLRTNIPLGITYFHVSQKNYETTEIGQYVNATRNRIIVSLNPTSTRIPIDEVKENQETITFDSETVEEYILEESTPNVDVYLEDKDTVPFAKLDPNDFNDNQFKPVTAIFIIDVSSSMKQADRLELMKYSLINLAQMLRKQDEIGIVSYANNPEVLLRPTTGNKKEQIVPIIEAVKAGGFTDGGAGIRKGLRVARWNINKDGPNHVFIISDGAFNRNTGNYRRWIKKSKRRGIEMSVVGIKTKDRDIPEMKEIAELGGGTFIPIDRLLDASQNLKQVVRKSAFISE